jgi:hypothetical protein
MSRWMNKIVIFDLDGTLADITARRKIATKDNGKMDWNIFQDPDMIDLDVPNQKVVDMLNMIDNTDKYQIYILSGRSDVTADATLNWLEDNGIRFDDIIMRPQKHLYMADNDLKQMWLDDIGVDNVAMVFDDRNQVVDMWRKNGLTCFQVADGDF